MKFSHCTRLAPTFVVLMTAVVSAFAQGIPDRVNPVHTSFDSLHVFGQMVLDNCEKGKGNFTGEIYNVGRLSKDGPPAWILQRIRCDTIFFEYMEPTDLLLYRMNGRKLPSVNNAERIGITELGSAVNFLCAGDFNNDGHKDIAVSAERFRDTSYGSNGDYQIATVIVFWASPSGAYSVEDTTQIPCEADTWMTSYYGTSYDFNGDSIDDLCVIGGSGFSNGKVVKIPRMHVYQGHNGQRWGRNDVSRQASWYWWNVPEFTSLNILDQDCDGIQDLILYKNRLTGGLASIHIIYGKSNQWPDTNDLQSVDLSIANAHYALLSDVTGDGVRDILADAGTENKVKVFVGAPGQRIIEQYGNGYDSLDRVNKRYPLRPWAEVWTPAHLHDGWFTSGPLLNFGDVTNDGADEIWSSSWPYLTGYVTRERMDSVVDVLYRINHYVSTTKLGNIDSSGTPTFAIGYRGGIMFLKPGTQIPLGVERLRRLPHDPGFRCGPTLDVETPTDDRNNPNTEAEPFGLHAVPNPTEDLVRFLWNHPPGTNAVLSIYDILGRETFRSAIASGTQPVLWDAHGQAPGIYTVTLSTPSHSESITIVVR